MKASRAKKLLFVLEGIDHSGKSTQIELLKKDFSEAVFTREPGGTPKAEEIREYLLSEPGSKLSETERMELFFEAREIHLKEKLLPSLKEGKIVISDRFDASTYAYQAKTQFLREKFWELRKKVLPRDLYIVYFFLEITTEESFRRKALAKGHNLNHFDLSARAEVDYRILRYREFFIDIQTHKKSKVYSFLVNRGSLESLHQEIKTIIYQDFYY